MDTRQTCSISRSFRADSIYRKQLSLKLPQFRLYYRGHAVVHPSFVPLDGLFLQMDDFDRERFQIIFDFVNGVEHADIRWTACTVFQLIGGVQFEDDCASRFYTAGEI